MRPASLAIILDPSKQRVLLIQRRDVPIWVLPGGGIESGETPEQALHREVWEETGLRINAVRKTGLYTPVNRLAGLTHVYECTIRDGVLRTGSETKEIAFWPIAALPKGLFVVHRDWLADALQQCPTPLQKPITSVTYRAVARFALRHPLIFLRFAWTRLAN